MMTEQQLRRALAQSLEHMDPASNLVHEFWAALLFRRKHATIDEREPGRLGFRYALERALALFDLEPVVTAHLSTTDPPSPGLSHELAAAVELLPSYVLTELLSRAREIGLPLESEIDVRMVLESALRKYSRLAKVSLSDGP